MFLIIRHYVLNFVFELFLKEHSEAGLVLSMFLIFGDFEPRCSYKIVLIKILFISTSNNQLSMAGSYPFSTI